MSKHYMDSRFKIQKLKKHSAITVNAVIFFLLLTVAPIFAQETDEKAEFEAMKAEWTKVRERQIEIILEKEEQLEELKEDLLRQMNELKKGRIIPVSEPIQDESHEDRESSSSEDILTRQMVQLKEANRRLADEISELKKQNAELEKKASAASGLEQLQILRKQMADFDLQKESFQKERQKFFQEMSRQRTRLEEQQSFLEAEKADLEEREKSEVSAT